MDGHADPVQYLRALPQRCSLVVACQEVSASWPQWDLLGLTPSVWKAEQPGTHTLTLTAWDGDHFFMLRSWPVVVTQDAAPTATPALGGAFTVVPSVDGSPGLSVTTDLKDSTVTASISASASAIRFDVDSSTHEGKTVLFEIPTGALRPDELASRVIKLDGRSIPRAASYAKVMDGNAPEASYWTEPGSDSTHLFIHVPSWSTHTIEIGSMSDERGESAPIPGYDLPVFVVMLAVFVLRRR
jgi:hypothetical protein